MSDARDLLNTIKYVRETYGSSVLTESEVNFLEVFTKNDNLKALSKWLKDEMLLISLREVKKAEQEILLYKMYKSLGEKVTDFLGDSFYEELLTELDVRSSWKLTVSRMVRYRDVKKREQAIMKVLNSINFSLYEVDVQKLLELFKVTRDVRYKDAIIKVLNMCNRDDVSKDLVFKED